MTELVLYDIPGNFPDSKAWSPSTWQTRYAMNYKGLRYRTEWVEFPDIEVTCKRVGAKPTSIRTDGTPLYTLPVLNDPSTSTIISDATAIAVYLDKIYPDTPVLIPSGTLGLYAAFKTAVDDCFTYKMYGFTVMRTFSCLNERSLEYYRRTREKAFGVALEAIAPPGAYATEQIWRDIETGLQIMSRWYAVGSDADSDSEHYLCGEKPTMADFFVAARLVWARIVLGEGSDNWKRISRVDGGRWGRFIETMRKYERVI